MKIRVVLSLCWVLIFLLSIWACAHLILKLWLKWDNSPVIVSFAETTTPVWQIPFPAVTVCSETKSRQTVFNFTRAFNSQDNLTEQQLKMFESVSLVCDNHLHPQGSERTDDGVVDILQQVTQPFEEMMWLAKFKNTVVTNTSELFSPLLTEEGICYTFNMLDSKELYTKEAFQKDFSVNTPGRKSVEWSLEAGYSRDARLDTYPNRALGAGLRAGLTIVLRAYTTDLDYLCRGPVQGFKIILHNPAEIPRVSNEYFRAPLNQEVLVAIKPVMMTTSEGLREYSPHRRQCYFPSERHLRYFQVYTQSNCALECITNYTLNFCGCVSFHMPRAKSTPICGSGKTKCVASAVDELLLKEIEEGLSDINSIFNSAANKTARYKDCDCLPACTDLQFDAETSQADYDWVRVFGANSEGDTEDLFPLGLNVARVNIFFKDSQFITSRRSELYGQTDFLANCGGLLGLFMGFSILSLVEIVYYCTLRVGCNIFRKQVPAEAEDMTVLASPLIASNDSEKPDKTWVEMP